MRWILLIATLLSWALCFTRQGAGAMAIWLFLGIVGAMGTVLAFVQARINTHARPENLHEQVQRPAGRDPYP